MQQLIASIVAAIEGGRHADALRMSRELAAALPGNQGALSLLAVAEQNVGHLDEARRILVDLTRDHPATWQHWNNLGNVLRLQGDLRGAAAAYEKALSRNAGSAKLLANLGLLHLNLGEFAAARDRLVAAIALPGAEPGMQVWAALACHACFDDRSATELVSAWRRWPSISEEARLELGWLLFQLGDTQSAEEVLAGSFRDVSVHQRAQARRVLMLERLNRLDEAVALVEELERSTSTGDAQARVETLQARAVLALRHGDDAAARSDYAAALGLDLPWRYRRPLYFGLARASDRLDDPDAAMDALAHAHAPDVETAELERTPPAGLLALADPKFALQRAFDAPAENTRATRGDPVFVVGFPRSGTTLVEQMLAAHADFESADERPFVQRVLNQFTASGRRYPDDLGALTAAARDALRALYWREADETVPRSAGVRLVDKHPLNFLALPMIRAVFRNAPMIFCVRHPCDVILSCYMQSFRDPGLAIACSSIERLAQTYVEVMQRWLHDRALLPDDNLEFRYEDLVADTDTVLEQIGAFLGIADVSAMRGFGEHAQKRGFIGTPSYSQVVATLNRDAVGRWRRYRRYFEPVLPMLAPFMKQWGYDD